MQRREFLKIGSAGASPDARMRLTGRAIKRDVGSSRFSGTISVPHSAGYSTSRATWTHGAAE